MIMTCRAGLVPARDKVQREIQKTCYSLPGGTSSSAAYRKHDFGLPCGLYSCKVAKTVSAVTAYPTLDTVISAPCGSISEIIFTKIRTPLQVIGTPARSSRGYRNKVLAQCGMQDGVSRARFAVRSILIGTQLDLEIPQEVEFARQRAKSFFDEVR